MLIPRLHQFFTAPVTNNSRLRVIFWLVLSLTFATIYAYQVLLRAFSSEYVVQDDARQFVFWMQRFVDRELLPNDLMADYYQSITPPGFAAFYWLMAKVGIAPLLLSKLLPMLLGLVTTVYVFGVSMEILPVPSTAFLSALLLNHSIWMRNDVASGTPKAFAYPLFAAFLYYLLRRKWIPCLVAIALEGLIFTPMAFISLGILLLRLLNWEKARLNFSRDRQDYIFCAAGLGVAFFAMLPYAIASSKYGPLISIAEAMKTPEFMAGARVSFFYNNNPLQYWFAGPETGVFPYVGPAQIFIGILLPIFLPFRDRFTLSKNITSGIKVLTETAIASFGMFFAAHLLMFKLYGPSRYTQHSLRIVLAICSAILLTLLLDAAFRLAYKKTLIRLLPLVFNFLILLAVVVYPNTLRFFPRPGYVMGEVPGIYQFLQQQPKDSAIASFALEANNLPTFAQRPILVAREYSLPFHTKYYAQIRQRIIDLVSAQYSTDVKEVRQFIQKYNIDFWLLDRTVFERNYFAELNAANRRWLELYQPATNQAKANLERGDIPALAKFMNSCSVFEEAELVLLKAECIVKSDR